MRTLLLVLACLAPRAQARTLEKRNDGPDAQQAFAALLLSVNPSLASAGYGGSRYRGGASRAPGAPPRSEYPGPPPQADLELDAAMEAAAASREAVVTGRTKAGKIRKTIATSDSVLVQGGSLKTWSYRSSIVDRVQVVLTTDGRPLDADVQLWQGPDNNPCKMRVYSEDGSTRPFRAVIATPDGGANTVAIYNIGQIEFPLAAYVTANDVDEPVSDFRQNSIIVQGGALRTFQFDNFVESVEIMLKTDGRPLNARIEMLQGPNNNKQVIELYTEDGLERPFFAIIDTMGSGNVVRVVNTAPIEFPMTAMVQPHSVNEKMSATDPVIGGGRTFG